MSSFPEAERLALAVLKGKENPFDSLARPQRLDDNFLDLHVPELLQGERALLLEVIDSYRVEEYTRTADLRPTRVVTILGDRGAGKTHLLQSLAFRTDGKSQLLVRPSYYDHHLPFEEYLLAQLMTGLATEDEVFRSRPIEDIAPALARRLLRQALRGLGPTERICAQAPCGWRRFRLLFGGGERECQTFNELIAALNAGSSIEPLPDVVRKHGFDARQCYRLIHGHLERYEVGPDLLAVLRRKFYAAMAQSALLGENGPLFGLLEGEYGEIGSGTTTRFEIVARLLHVVTEVCALVRQPIIFAFDNLERLFSPHNQFDGDLVRAFFNSLAQAVDNTKGLLILLFAENGLFERAASFMDEFARHRLEQGVPIFGRGPTKIIRLRAPATEEIRTLVQSRVGRMLASCPAAAAVAPSFPFDEAALQKAGTEHQSLRNTLLRLRDEYSTRVYEEPAPAQEPVGINWENLLESAWQKQYALAARLLENGLAGQMHKLHAGLGTLLDQVAPIAVDSWLLAEVQPTASIGDNPTYGVVSLLTWKPEGTDNGTALKMGVGFLLARGPGMPHDLRSKLDFFRRPAKGQHLLVLWPTPSDRDDLVEALPNATRSVWNESRHRNNMTLRRVGVDELSMLLAVPDWLNALGAAADQPIPAEILQAFIKQHFPSLFTLLVPAPGVP